MEVVALLRELDSARVFFGIGFGVFMESAKILLRSRLSKSCLVRMSVNGSNCVLAISSLKYLVDEVKWVASGPGTPKLLAPN